MYTMFVHHTSLQLYLKFDILELPVLSLIYWAGIFYLSVDRRYSVDAIPIVHLNTDWFLQMNGLAMIAW